MVTAQSLLNVARKYIGVTQWSSQHKGLIDSYNKVVPKPMSYAVQYSDDWCDVFVTVIADKAGASKLIGRECGVQRHIHIFQNLGIWVGRVFPKAGDIVTFDWDCAGWADHIGYVESVSGTTITTIEGNSNNKVNRNRFVWNDWRIKGYARPKYEVLGEVKQSVDELAKEVIAGNWGIGQERINKLLASGYDASSVQNKVNEMLRLAQDKAADTDTIKTIKYNGASLSEAHIKKIIGLAKKYQILPSLLIVMLHFEGLWGNSNVAKIDNNWGGMTWSEGYVGNPNINKSKGSKRPTDEGGHYIHYSTVEDFFEDWVYLLRPDGIYKVSGIGQFNKAVKGLFKTGGAKYDYAAVGYAKYYELMLARKSAIEKANGGMLDYLNQLLELEQKDENSDQSIEKVKIAEDALYWQTGEKISSWVKGLEFEILNRKEVTQQAVLLGNDGIAIGWIFETSLVK